MSFEKANQLINLVGELITTQSMRAPQCKQIDPALYQQLAAGLVDLDRHPRRLQASVMSIRMIPMSLVYARFPRMLRDLAARLGKMIEFVMQGGATELDKLESDSKLVVEESVAAAESLRDQSRNLSDVVASFGLAPNSNQNQNQNPNANSNPNPRPMRAQTA